MELIVVSIELNVTDQVNRVLYIGCGERLLVGHDHQ